MLDEVVPPANQQQLDIRSTPREEMSLTPLDTFEYEYVGKEIWVEFEIPEFTAICPFSDGWARNETTAPVAMRANRTRRNRAFDNDASGNRRQG